jgi:hypothetical protein
VPFTLSHPAAVLLLRGRRLGRVVGVLALPALVAGSMAPDVPYYAPLPPTTRQWTHSWVGAFTVDVGLAVLLLAVGVFVAAPVASLLVPRARELVGDWTASAWPSARSVRAVGVWYLALAVGALSHVLWDAFTHGEGQVVQLVPSLRQVVAGQALYEWLQILSSVVGGAIVVLVVVRVYRAEPDDGSGVPDPRRLALVAGAAMTSAVVGGLLRPGLSQWSWFNVVTGACAGALLAVLVYAGWARWGERVAR